MRERTRRVGASAASPTPGSARQGKDIILGRVTLKDVSYANPRLLSLKWKKPSRSAKIKDYDKIKSDFNIIQWNPGRPLQMRRDTS